MKVTGYNILRDDSTLLDENANSPPSLTVYLFPDYWTLNNGPKFLYNNQVSVRAIFLMYRVLRLLMTHVCYPVHPRGHTSISNTR